MNLQSYAGKIMVKEHLPTNAFHIPGFYYLQDKPGTIFYVGEYQKHFQISWEHLEYQNMHCVRSVSIWNYSGLHFPHSDSIRRDTSYLSVFSPNTGKWHRSSRWQMFLKTGVLKNLALFTGKHLCWSLSSIKL